MQKRGLGRQIVHNSAAVKHICFKFGTNVLNWTLYDPRNSFLKRTPDGEIIAYFLKGWHFLCRTLYMLTETSLLLTTDDDRTLNRYLFNIL